MHQKTSVLILTLALFLSDSVKAQPTCPVTNHAFNSGEQLDYKVNYNWGWIWLESATATFKVKSGVYNNKPSFTFSGSGSTYPKHDWFFKVRDVFETTVDSVTLRPYRFKADVHEGSKNDKHTYLFDNLKLKAYTVISRGNKKVKVDTLDISPCTIDVLTAIYYARNLDYSKCKPNDTIGISVLMDGKVFPLYVRYVGREDLTSEKLGKYRCIKFKPLLVEGSIFDAGENMTVWVTDDENKLPLYIETSIVVGSIKVYLIERKGLRHPETSKIR